VGAVAQFVRHGAGVKAGDRVTVTAENAEALAKQGARFVVYKPKELALAAGDTVRFTANDWDVTGKHRLNNGAVYQVDGFDGDNVRLSNGWEVDARKALHLDHGYVSTSHGAQGKTTDRVLIAQSSTSFPASDASQFYVSVSRGRQQAVIYTDDKEALLEAIERDRPRMLAHDLVRQPRQHLARKKKRAMAFMRDLAEKFRGKEAAKELPRDRGREKE
jgi:ATP-dependent exoDNAse (exonuclease V) alpha subunit